MIGNIDDAAAALSDYRAHDMVDLFSAEGSTRYVFLINGVLYKVENGEHYGVNATEYGIINEFKDTLPDNVHFPETSLFEVDGEFIIATELIRGQLKYECCDINDSEHDEYCLTDDELVLLKGYLSDTGGMNIIHNDDGYWIIDAA